MSTNRTHRIHRTRLSVVRRAALLSVGAAAAFGLTAGLTDAASALTPQPDLPIAVAQPDIDPPVDPTPPLPAGPEDLVVPPIVDDPFPVPPVGPGDLTIGEPDPEVPEPQPEPEPEPGDGIPQGPGDLTAEPDPTHPDPTVPEPEVLDETEDAAGLSDVAAPEASADTLAFTGGDLGLVTAGGALLVAGALAAGAATVARRRQGTESAELS